jgi:hypothetical protein
MSRGRQLALGAQFSASPTPVVAVADVAVARTQDVGVEIAATTGTTLRRGDCGHCGRNCDLTPTGRLPKHCQLKFKASKGGAYVSSVPCPGRFSLPAVPEDGAQG